MAKIVVVDDEPSLASTITYNLRRDGHDVFTAADGQLALRHPFRSRVLVVGAGARTAERGGNRWEERL